ncbi:hypothetical protein SAMN02927900_02720 [Rhizobium mongolense subsp. loessense]|uniref:Uncharacterized protein n=1 Tax=Rhizobium mongolense subsp. loessense TaxID=158890 RepID=A0A1G4RI15_9HYPH|nr:hypothetical protein SAMN02927900_02720 [Rhizobium mongolense subsp. loessense]
MWILPPTEPLCRQTFNAEIRRIILSVGRTDLVGLPWQTSDCVTAAQSEMKLTSKDLTAGKPQADARSSKDLAAGGNVSQTLPGPERRPAPRASPSWLMIWMLRPVPAGGTGRCPPCPPPPPNSTGRAAIASFLKALYIPSMKKPRRHGRPLRPCRYAGSGEYRGHVPALIPPSRGK